MNFFRGGGKCDSRFLLQLSTGQISGLNSAHQCRGSTQVDRRRYPSGTLPSSLEEHRLEGPHLSKDSDF